MKSLILAGIAALLLPVAAIAQTDPAPAADPAAAAAPAAALPKCTAKVQDSCDQSKTTEKSALDHYPADTRDAGNNKIGAVAAPAHRAAKHSTKRAAKKAAVEATPAPAAAQ